MRTFETTSMYDFENQEWVELYHIDGEEVDAETYFEEMEYETDGDNEDECDGDCSNCDKNEDIDDETKAEIALIEDLAEDVESADCTCGCVLRNTLYEAYNLGKQVGFNDCKEVFRSVVDHLDD